MCGSGQNPYELFIQLLYLKDGRRLIDKGICTDYNALDSDPVCRAKRIRPGGEAECAQGDLWFVLGDPVIWNRL
jgi:hypothetical protein